LEYLIGAGGWSYFKVGNKSSLKVYSEIFNFVEVNSTFYEYPKLSLLEGWRRLVPEDFTFSLRCNQDLTHRIGLKPVDEAYDVFYKMKAYCEALESPFLVFETSTNYSFDTEDILDAKEFLSTISLGKVRIVWEYRAKNAVDIMNLMKDYNIIQCVDFSKHTPTLSSDVAYSRLFGKGKHNIYQFLDEELLDIEHTAKESQAETVVLSFHGQRMYNDAARLKMHIATGKFIPVTDYFGIDSAKSVLAQDAVFPSSKAQLISDQGWKVIDLSADKRIHLSELLETIPDKTYINLNEVTAELRRSFE